MKLCCITIRNKQLSAKILIFVSNYLSSYTPDDRYDDFCKIFSYSILQQFQLFFGNQLWHLDINCWLHFNFWQLRKVHPTFCLKGSPIYLVNPEMFEGWYYSKEGSRHKVFKKNYLNFFMSSLRYLLNFKENSTSQCFYI